jgi:hypothetical protein
MSGAQQSPVWIPDELIASPRSCCPIYSLATHERERDGGEDCNSCARCAVDWFEVKRERPPRIVDYKYVVAPRAGAGAAPFASGARERSVR